jgi:hypothetical protein
MIKEEVIALRYCYKLLVIVGIVGIGQQLLIFVIDDVRSGYLVCFKFVPLLFYGF